MSCLVTEPQWVMPPGDSAVSEEPAYGYYYVNEDGSILASAWWTGQEEKYLRVDDEGLKVGWFRPEGADLEISGRRIGRQSEPMNAHVPCCYPTRFQSSGLFFPEEGCWEVTAKAADSQISFIHWLEP